jgi:hypothetical protein
MSGAAKLHERLLAVVEDMALDARIPFAQRRKAVQMPDDLVAAMETSVDLIVALEDAVAGIDARAERIRAVLADVMNESGATTIRAGTHTASVSPSRQGVVITDPDAIPPTLMRQPEPTPDRAAIGSLLKAGQPVLGATLGNGGVTLTIRSKAR